jgi:hypothetical protein
MVYDTKIQKAQEIIDNFNASADKKVDWKDFLKQLNAAGGTTDETLSECSWEDLKGMGVPPLVAKQLAKVFRQSDKPETKILSSVRVSVMTPKELLEHYVPTESDAPVAERLKTISKGKKFIVFNEDGSVNPISATLLQELKDGFPERETYFLDGKPCCLYAIGERLDNLADINPLYPNRILRPDGTCDQINRSWQGISDELRYIILLGVSKTREIQVIHETAHNILDIVMSENAEQKLIQRYPKASMLYEQLKRENNLPSLKVSLGNNMKIDKSNNPFYASEHKEY